MSPPVFSTCAAARPWPWCHVRFRRTDNKLQSAWLADGSGSQCHSLQTSSSRHQDCLWETPLWWCFPVFTCATFRCHAFSVTGSALKETLLLISSELKQFFFLILQIVKTHMYMYMYICICTCTNIYVIKHVYIYMCVCAYIYLFSIPCDTNRSL